MKYKFNIKEILYNLFIEREMAGKEITLSIKLSELCENFVNTLSDQQIESFKKIEKIYDELEYVNEESLISFVVDFFQEINS